jgi:hypothetical protein
MTREKVRFMKTKAIVGFALCIVALSLMAFGAARSHSAADGLSRDAIASAADNGHSLDSASNPARLSTDQPVIANALGTGQGTREQMAHDIDESRNTLSTHIPSGAEETIDIGSPFLSLQLSPSLVKYLGLTRQQDRAIQRSIDQARRTTEPLMQELRSVNEKLLAANQSGAVGEGAARGLGVAQARVLKQLMRTNSRLQQKINDVLDSRQRRKLDLLKRANEPVEAGQ